MSTLTGSLLLVILALVAACLVLWQRGNVHKHKRLANAEESHRLRMRNRSLRLQINAMQIEGNIAELMDDLRAFERGEAL